MRTYRSRIAEGRAELESWESEARRAIDMYRTLKMTEDERVVEGEFEGNVYRVPTGSATIDALFASLTAVQIDFIVRNRAHGTIEQRNLAETGIQEVWRDQRGAQKADHVIKDALLPAIGYMKVGYDWATRVKTETRKPEAITEDINVLFQTAEERGEEPPTQQEIEALVPVEEDIEEVIRDRITLDYLPWDMVMYDPQARTPDDIRYYIEIEYAPTYEVWESPEFQQYLKDHGEPLSKLTKLTPDARVKQNDKVAKRRTLFKRNDKNPEDDRITLYHVYDLEAGVKCTITEQSDLILNEKPIAFGMHPDLYDRSPIVPLIMRGDPEGIRGISDMTLIEPLLRELNHYRNKLAAYISRFEGKLMGPEDALTDEGRAALSGDSDDMYVALAQNHTRQEVGPMEVPQLPTEIFLVIERIINDIREVTGVSELMRGIFPDRKRTATETTEVVAASSARQSEKRNRLERFYTDIGKRILWLMMLWYDDKRVSRLSDINIDADEVWEWTAEDIAMEADLEVTLTPKVSRSFQERKEDAQFILATLGPFEEVDKRELAALVMDEMGYDRQRTRKLLKLEEEIEGEKQQAMQDQVAMAGATAQAETEASQGIPPTVQAAADAGQFGGASTATDYLATP